MLEKLVLESRERDTDRHGGGARGDQQTPARPRADPPTCKKDT